MRPDWNCRASGATSSEAEILSERVYSAKEEQRILDALGRGLMREFPNPARTGCPSSHVLRRIASRRMPLAEAEPWLEHLTSCSPCYRDFSQFREEYQGRHTRILLALAASILIVACLAGWALVHWRNEALLAQTAILDLRDRSISRGAEPNPGERPLEVSRAVTHLTIYLPLGTSEGLYDVRIVALSGESLAATHGTAHLNGHATSLQVVLGLKSLRNEKCVLQIRRPESDWQSYSLVLR